MQELRTWFTDLEMETLRKLKGDETWRVFLLRAAGVDDIQEIKLGRPAKTSLDSLFGKDWKKTDASDVTDPTDPQASMNGLYGKGWQEGRKGTKKE